MANSYASSPVTASQVWIRFCRVLIDEVMVGSYFVQQYYQVLQQ
ncbi:hypothetical protein HanPI659440_Chr12g0445411 [Helianthus annuus]|nr:hypothetical protein HanPI659440_Chr12g0445411 [Helianthus annuus]